jgi:hypothetical protein
MSAIVRALEAVPNEWAESELARPVEMNRWGAVIRAADEPVDRAYRANDKEQPLPLWLVAVAYSNQIR